MHRWPGNPVIYEINTRVWVEELSRAAGRALTLASIPDREWDRVVPAGVDAVWLMGVWERSPAGMAIANRNPGLLADFQRALPDYRIEDNVGSPYCVRRYEVDARLGGPAGLASARQALARRGVGLVLDFVPNHVAPDHPWVLEHPEFFIRGSLADQAARPAAFVQIDGNVFACGKDPFFPAWPDVLQLNMFAPGLRRAVADTLSDIAAQCDAVRCDMAMLCMNSVFARTWGDRAGAVPAADYWPELIPAVKAQYPEFRFIAEAYWDLEWELQQQGFDYCYDKRLYDRMEHGPADAVRGHLCADLPYQERMIRFIENHDEPRAAAAFPDARARAAAVTILTLPGAKLLHEGQFEGRHVRLPVFLARRPAEPVDAELQAFYSKLLQITAGAKFRQGIWRLCDCTGWPDNDSFRHVVAWCWTGDSGRALVIVNLSDAPSQANVRVPWDDLAGRNWRLEDPMAEETFYRRGDDMCGPGLYVDLAPWQFHLFRFET